MGFRQFGPYILTFEEKANAVRAAETVRVGQEFGQGRAGPRSNNIKGLRGGIFHPHILDRDGKPHVLGCGREEIAFLGRGFEQGHRDLIAEHFRQDQPGEAGSGAQIRDCSSVCRDQGCQLG